jgi:PAS domain S-box-containing protein
MDKLLNAFLEALPLPIVGVDRRGRVILWNAAAEAVLGWTAAEVMGKLYPAIPHGLQEAHERLRESIFEGRVLPHHETRRRRKDGSEFDVVITIAAARGPNGSIDAALAVLHDLTPMRDAQRRLSSAEHGYQSLLETANALAAFAQRAVTERDGEALRRAAVADVMTALQADYAELLPVGEVRRRDRQSLVASASDAEPLLRELTSADKTGAPHLRGYRYGAAVCVGSGDVAYVLAAYSKTAPFHRGALHPLQTIAAMFAAATARSAAEDQLAEGKNRLRLLLDQLPAIVAVVDRDMRFTSAQGAGLAALGLDPKAMVGQTIDLLGGSKAAIATRTALGGEPTRFEHTYNGRTFDNLVEPLRDRDGTIKGAIKLSIDITERREAEVALADSREQLRRLSSALNHLQEAERRRIAREVHDELGQRLTSLRLDLDLLRNEWCGGALEQANARITAMFGLIDETLGTVRRVATALRPAVLDDFGFRAALEQELASLRKRTGIATTSSFCPDDLAVDADRATALYRIVQEALTNIARHAGATLVDVHIEASSDDLCAEIMDDGRGITAEEIDSRTTLGLLGMRERANALGGSVIIEGSPGRGTRVLVKIPR